VAKIAGQHLAKGHPGSVALLTLDTYRVGAFDHLRSYAEILKTQVQVATNAAELDSLVRRNLDADLVLIDTAGGNPRDRRLMEALGAVIGSNPLIETHLCVSATTKPRDLRDIHERFSALAIEKLVFTKIDETCSGGALYNLLAESGRPLAFMTDGQRVPEDLHLATRESLCRWVMGA
jgi:flagellar biosynthesis protein FlhF